MTWWFLKNLFIWSEERRQHRFYFIFGLWLQVAWNTNRGAVARCHISKGLACVSEVGAPEFGTCCSIIGTWWDRPSIGIIFLSNIKFFLWVVLKIFFFFFLVRYKYWYLHDFVVFRKCWNTTLLTESQPKLLWIILILIALINLSSEPHHLSDWVSSLRFEVSSEECHHHLGDFSVWLIDIRDFTIYVYFSVLKFTQIIVSICYGIELWGSSWLLVGLWKSSTPRGLTSVWFYFTKKRRDVMLFNSSGC